MKSVILHCLFIILLISQFNVYSQYSDDPIINSILMNMVNDRKYDAVLPLNNGGEIVAWSEGQYIYAQKLNTNGKRLWKPEGIFVEKNNEGEGINHLRIVSDCSGGAIIVWAKDYWESNNWIGSNIFAQRIDSVGNLKWAGNGIKVSTYPVPCIKLFSTSNSVKNVISDGVGGAIITWQDYRYPDGYYSIYGQRINSSGELKWNTDGIPIGIKTFDQPEYYHEIASSGDGGAFICGRKALAASINRFEFYIKKIDSLGNLKWNSNGVPINSAFREKYSIRIISDGSQGALIYWGISDSTSFSIRVQKINSDGVLQWSENGIPACLFLNSLSVGFENNLEY